MQSARDNSESASRFTAGASAFFHLFSALTRRGWSIGTDMLRVLILRVSSDGEERDQDSEDNPNVNAHQRSPGS
jgi:hypothetical protein